MKILMCRPDYYGIEYEINPWMHVAHKADHPAAVEQWEKLYQTIIECGAQIELIKPSPGWPDMVFTANAGLIYQNNVVLSHFKFKERQGETTYFKSWFENNKFNIANPIQVNTPFFEGAGDALFAGDLLFAGYGFRTERAFYENQKLFNPDKLIYCELTDPYFYHIDTCFCPVTKDLAIWYPPAFSKVSQKKMEKKIELITVSKDEAKKFACNAVVINKNVILPADCPKITSLLAQRGWNPHPLVMNEYLKAGGACKCLTLTLE